MAQNSSEMIRRMLEISGSLDIETMGLDPGAGIHEVAYAKLNKNLEIGNVDQFILSPNAVFNIEADQLTTYQKGRVPHSLDKIRGADPRWRDVDIANLIKTGKLNTWDPTDKQLIDALMGQESFRHESVVRSQAHPTGRYPWMTSYDPKSGQFVAPVATTNREIAEQVRGSAARSGIDIGRLNVQRTTVNKLLEHDSTLARRLRNNITWIANTQFESRQIGASLDLLEHDLIERGIAENLDRQTATSRAQAQTLRHDLPYQNPRSTALLYTTGKEYNLARSRAVLGTGSWTDAWKTMLQHTGKGDVRDIFDVMKVQEEYLRKIAPGLLSKESTITGGIDIQYRLMMAAERGNVGFGLAEPHIAAVDSPIQLEMAKRLLPETAAMQAVHEGTEQGRLLVEQARQGKGDLYRALMRHSMTQALMPDFQRSNVLKRLDEAYRDIAINQTTKQFTHHKMKSISVSSPMIGPLQPGQTARPMVKDTWEISVPHHRSIDSLSGVIEHMEGSPAHYPADILKEEVDAYRAMLSQPIPEGLDEKQTRDLLISRSQTYTAQRRDSLVGAQALDAAFERVGGSEAFLTKTRETLAGQKFSIGQQKTLMPKFGGLGTAMAVGASIMALMGAAGTLAGGREPERAPSLRRTDYQSWLSRQDEYFGTRGVGSYDNGMGHGGIAGAKRPTNTDFGSPYQGPVAASHVFMQQDMLAEREKFLRQRFANIHTGQGTFYPSIGRGSHRFVQGGKSAQGMKLPGVTGGSDNLQILDLSKWKVTANDADTITVKRGGIRGALQSFFGMNRGYEFRLAGIDAPETFHGELGMKSAQPHADDATLALQAMMGNTGNLHIVYDPENITYGRMVGAVIADGKNVNFELVKQGHTMALPFYKKGTTPLLDTKGIERLENFSRRNQTGMWANPYFQVYSDVEDISGNRVTLNTFSRMSKLATNATTMSLGSLMQNAQDQGFVGTADRIAAAEIGNRYKDIGFSEDYRNIMMMGQKNIPHKSYLHEMAIDSAELMKTRGSPQPYRTSHRSGYGSLNKTLAIDTLGTTNSIWNKRKLSSYEVYGVERERNRRRREDMAANQRHALKGMFTSPINHHRM